MFTASALMAERGISAVFSDTQGGCSPAPFATLNLGLDLGDTRRNVTFNLQQLCEKSGLQTPHQAQQVHGTHILHCTGVGMLHDVQADILLSDESHVALAVRTADCLPILLADPEANVIAAVHAGWRGTVAQVAKVAVQGMFELGAKPERILASFGASIAACCFEVNADIRHQLLVCCGQDVTEKRGGMYYADLALANQYQLLHCGVLPAHIECVPACTYCSEQPHFFSYRRDHGQTGRQLSIISME